MYIISLESLKLISWLVSKLCQTKPFNRLREVERSRPTLIDIAVFDWIFEIDRQSILTICMYKWNIVSVYTWCFIVENECLYINKYTK